MKIVFCFFAALSLLAASRLVQAQGISGGESCVVSRECLRGKFQEAQKSEKKTQELLELIKNQLSVEPENYPAITLAYYGAANGLKAKHAFNPVRKLNGLSLALKLLDKAVIKDPNDFEVRFVRFATLSHLPSFFGGGEKRLEDVATLCVSLAKRDYSTVDRKTQLEMAEFMLKYAKLSKEQKNSLKNLIKDLSGT